MAIYELKSFIDIVTAVREELKIQSADSESIIRIKRNINIAYQDICANNWPWLRKQLDITHAAKTTGTCAVTLNSRVVTLSAAVTDSKAGYKFSVNDKIYKIASHAGSGTAVELETEYVDGSNAATTYKIWTDVVPLPPDCRDLDTVYLDEKYIPLEMSGMKIFREKVLLGPKEAGSPRYGSVSAKIDPGQFSAVSGAPVVTHTTSAGLIKTLKFGSTPAAHYPLGTRIKVSGATATDYNGEYIVSTVTTTTVTYTGNVSSTLAETADNGITLLAENSEGADESYTQLLIHPSLTDNYHTLHFDYERFVKPLEDDTDEPLMPITDRRVLLYAALSSSWVRERNEEVSQRSELLYRDKLKSMKSKLDDSSEQVRFKISKQYLAIKRRRLRLPFDFKRMD